MKQNEWNDWLSVEPSLKPLGQDAGLPVCLQRVCIALWWRTLQLTFWGEKKTEKKVGKEKSPTFSAHRILRT